MSRQRKRHVQKTIPERSAYMERIIKRPDPTPTIPDSDNEYDSTDSSPLQEESQQIELTKNQKWDTKSDYINFPNIAKGLVSFLLLSLLAWGAIQIYNFNREIGEIRNDMNHLTKNLQSLSENINTNSIRLEQRLEKQIERNDKEIRELKESQRITK